MMIAVMQPYLFPHLPYYQLMYAVDKFVVADDMAYIKQGWINRNRLLINGVAAYFTVPVRRHSADALIRDVMIDDAGRWRLTMVRTISNFYRRAPHFDDVFPMVERVLCGSFTGISEMARASLIEVFRYLALPIDLVPSSAVYQNAHLKGQARVIDICRTEAASEYINSLGGWELYSPAAFESHGIRLRFLKPDEIQYPQFDGPFLPSLSVIDALMFNSRSQVEGLLKRYQLL